LIALVRNHGTAERRTELRWAADGAPLAGRFVDVPAGAAVEVRLERSVPANAVVTASIEDATGYTADNTRFFVTDPPHPLQVLLISSVDDVRDTGMYVRAALEAATAADSAAFTVTRVTAEDALLSDARALSTARVLVVVGTRGLGRSARVAIAEAVRSGVGLLVAAGPDVEPGVVRDLLGDAGRGLGEGAPADSVTEGLVATEVRHPVLSALGDTAANLGQIRVERIWAIRDLPGATTLLRYRSGQPALSELPVGKGHAFVLTTDLGRRWNTWPLHPTFVPFVVEALRHLSGETGRAREMLVSTTPGASTSRPGVLTLGPAGERVPINVDPRESGVAAVTPEEFFARIERTSEPSAPTNAPPQEPGEGLWRITLLALLGVLAAEGLIAARPRSSRGNVQADATGGVS
jgi:hypothetical protein